MLPYTVNPNSIGTGDGISLCYSLVILIVEIIVATVIIIGVRRRLTGIAQVFSLCIRVVGFSTLFTGDSAGTVNAPSRVIGTGTGRVVFAFEHGIFSKKGMNVTWTSITAKCCLSMP